jgi:signal transduction histidine kinase
VQGGDGRLPVTVSDQGAGMDEQTRDHAFDQFYRAEPARKLAPDGSGVGLYAAQGLMRAMDGSVEIASQLGRGTSVTLAIPAESSGEIGD